MSKRRFRINLQSVAVLSALTLGVLLPQQSAEAARQTFKVKSGASRQGMFLKSPGSASSVSHNISGPILKDRVKPISLIKNGPNKGKEIDIDKKRERKAARKQERAKRSAKMQSRSSTRLRVERGAARAIDKTVGSLSNSDNLVTKLGSLVAPGAMFLLSGQAANFEASPVLTVMKGIAATMSVVVFTSAMSKAPDTAAPDQLRELARRGDASPKEIAALRSMDGTTAAIGAQRKEQRKIAKFKGRGENFAGQKANAKLLKTRKAAIKRWSDSEKAAEQKSAEYKVAQEARKAELAKYAHLAVAPVVGANGNGSVPDTRDSVSDGPRGGDRAPPPCGPWTCPKSLCRATGS